MTCPGYRTRPGRPRPAARAGTPGRDPHRWPNHAGVAGDGAGGTGPVARESKRGLAALRTADFVAAGQVAVSSASSVVMRLRMSSPPVSCMASATISTVVVPGWTADLPLYRFVQRRACAFPAASAKITSPGRGCSVSPEKAR